MKCKILFISFFLTLFTTSSSFAWGKKGHSLVAEIALQYLDANAKKNVLAYLNGMTIEDAANWMDTMRSDSNFDFMKPYHYINIDKNTTPKELEGDNMEKSYVGKGIVSVEIKNAELLEKLQDASPGNWRKIYEAGILNGRKVEIHYFENSETYQVFDVKIKYNYWHQKAFKNLE